MHQLRMLQMSTSYISLKDMNGDHPLLWTQTVFEGHFITTLFCQRRTCWNNICTKSEVYPSCWFFNSDGYILPLIPFSFL